MVHNFDMLQSVRFPFWMRGGFWPLVQWCVYPWSSQSFSKERTAGVSSRSIPLTNKSNCLTYTVASSLVWTSPLAVVGLLDVLMVSNSAESSLSCWPYAKSLPSQKQTLFPMGFFVDAAGSTHSSAGNWNVTLPFSLTLNSFLSRFQSLIWAHRCCHSLSLHGTCPQIS